MIAPVLLIIACRDAEGNNAAADPASKEAEYAAKDPGKSSLHVLRVGHAGVVAELARHNYGVVGPVVWWVCTGKSSVENRHSLHGLSLHGLTSVHYWLLGSILRLSLHGLGSIYWLLGLLLLLEHWLGFHDGLASHRVHVFDLL